MYLIWLIRCEHTIQEREHTAREITLKWTARVNRQINEDRVLMLTARNKHLSALIKSTWNQTLQKNGAKEEPPDWSPGKHLDIRQ